LPRRKSLNNQEAIVARLPSNRFKPSQTWLKKMNPMKKSTRRCLPCRGIKHLLTCLRNLMRIRKVPIQQCRLDLSMSISLVISFHLIQQLKDLIISTCLTSRKSKLSNLLPGRRNRSLRNNKIENIWRQNYSIRARKTLPASSTHRALSNNNKRSSYWEIWITANRY